MSCLKIKLRHIPLILIIVSIITYNDTQHEHEVNHKPSMTHIVKSVESKTKQIKTDAKHIKCNNIHNITHLFSKECYKHLKDKLLKEFK